MEHFLLLVRTGFSLIAENVPDCPRISQASVGLSATGGTLIRLGQETGGVVRRVLVHRNGIIGKFLLPMPAPRVIRVILEIEQVIFLAAAAEHLDVVRRIPSQRQCLCFFPQGIGPEMGIELAVAEMVCLFYKHMKQGELLDYLPEFCRQFLVLERIRRWE